MRFLDLYCGAGGVAVGMHRAYPKAEIIGVDINPQPHYPFTFVQGDALHPPFDLKGFDFIWASPPCQWASTIAKMNRSIRPGRYKHPNLVAATRELLKRSGRPYVIENVVGAELINPVRLCGSWFGLNLRRHRLFECTSPILSTPCSHQWQTPRFYSADRRRKRTIGFVRVHGSTSFRGEFELRKQAMGIDWMDNRELTQAIPPAYAEYILKQMRLK